MPIIDGHMDTVYALNFSRRKFAERSENGHVDLPRLKEGGVKLVFFAVFPASSPYYIAAGVDRWFSLVEPPENNLMHVKRPDDIDKVLKSEKIGAILHFEGAGGIDTEFINLRNYYRLGLRSMGLAWSNLNIFATGVGTKEDRGLTAEGKELVKEMEKLGIIVDVSHLNEKSFWDVVDIAQKPIIASHSNAYAICNHIRNLKDDQIKAIAELDGTIGINFSISFLASNKTKETVSFEDVKAHIDHILNLVGPDHISLGSDFDGTSVPDILKDVSFYPKLLEYLEENGYTKQDLEKIAYKNFVRVMKNVWK